VPQNDRLGTGGDAVLTELAERFMELMLGAILRRGHSNPSVTEGRLALASWAAHTISDTLSSPVFDKNVVIDTFVTAVVRRKAVLDDMHTLG